MILDGPFLDITYFESGPEKHLKCLKTEVESVVAVVAAFEPRVMIYLYGSMSRWIFGRKEICGRKIFCDKSDVDILIKLPDDIVASNDDFRKLCEDLRHKLYPEEKPQAIDEHIIARIKGESKLGYRSFVCNADLEGFFFREMITNQEAILLYGDGQWSIPWREEGFVPTIKE